MPAVIAESATRIPYQHRGKVAVKSRRKMSSILENVALELLFGVRSTNAKAEEKNTSDTIGWEYVVSILKKSWQSPVSLFSKFCFLVFFFFVGSSLVAATWLRLRIRLATDVRCSTLSVYTGKPRCELRRFLLSLFSTLISPVFWATAFRHIPSAWKYISLRAIC